MNENVVNEKEFYQKEIIEMVDEIENSKFLGFLYHMIIAFKEKWGIV